MDNLLKGVLGGVKGILENTLKAQNIDVMRAGAQAARDMLAGLLKQFEEVPAATALTLELPKDSSSGLAPDANAIRNEFTE